MKFIFVSYMMTTLAARLNQLIQEKGLTIRRLAEIADVKHTAISRWTNGTTANPGQDDLERVAKALGVNHIWLRTGVGPMTLSPLANLTAKDFQDLPDKGGPHATSPVESDDTFDPELMEQVIRLVEDYIRLYRKRFDDEQRVELMENAYQVCKDAGLRGQLSMSQFQELLKGHRVIK
jgi:transcriptional regulator with XRE-family HTH domain